MGRRERHQIDPLSRHQWNVRRRMASGELDPDLAALMLSMSEEASRTTQGDSLMLRALQAAFLGLYERLENGSTADLMVHSRAVNQLDALARSIRLAIQREHVGVRGQSVFPRRELFSAVSLPPGRQEVEGDGDPDDHEDDNAASAAMED